MSAQTSVSLACPGGSSFDGQVRVPFVLQVNGECVIQVELDGSVTVTREMTTAEMAMFDEPDNWTWGPLAKALLASRNLKRVKLT